MSITVRLWSKEDLQKAKKDEWLATLLMNKSTYSTKEIDAVYSLNFKKRTFECFWIDRDNHEEKTIVKAPNIKMLETFIDAEYNERPTQVWEVITDYKEIQLKA